MKIRRFLVAVGAVVLLVQNPAFAQEIRSTSARIFDVGFDAGDLLPRWTETGLTTASVDYSVTGTVMATYACVMGRRAAETLDPVGGPFEMSFTLPVSRKGVTGNTVDVEEPDPAVDSCRGMGEIVLYNVSYTNVKINDLTNDISELVGVGNFSMTFCNLSKNPQNCPPPS